MKQFLRHIFLLVAIFIATTNTWAECYVLNDANGGSFTCSMSLIGNRDRSYEPIALSGPGYQLTFEASRNNRTAVGDIEIQQYVDGSWKTIETCMPSGKDTYQSFGPYTLDPSATKVRFYNGYGSYSRSIRNIKVTRQISISASPNPITLDETSIGATSSPKTLTVNYSNIGTTQVVTPTSTADFTITPLQNSFDACTGTATYQITFHPQGTTGGERTASFTIAGRESGSTSNKAAVTITAKGIAKGQPVHTWNGNYQYYVGDQIDLPSTWISTNTNTNAPRTYSVINHTESSNINEGATTPYINGNNQLILGKAGVLKIQMYQLGNDTYSPLTSEVTLTIVKRPTSFDLKTIAQCKTGDIFPYNALFNTLTNNAEVPMTFTSGDESILKYENNQLTAVCAGTTTFTVAQAETYKWLGHAQTLNITVNKYNSDFKLLNDVHTRKIGEVITEAQLYTSSNNEILPTIVSSDPEVVAFNPTTRQLEAKTAGEAIITISQPIDCKWTDYSATCKVIVQKHTPVFTWKDPVYFNSTITDFFTTNNTDTEVTITSQTDTDVAVAYFSTNDPNDKHTLDLTTYNKEGSTELTVYQAENYYWYEHRESKVITPTNLDNHVTRTPLKETNRTAFDRGSYILNDWNDQTIQFGDRGGGFNYDDKYLIIEFSGIPDSLTFTTSTEWSATNGTSNLFFYVEAGETKESMTRIWSSSAKENTVKYKFENNDIRWLKICYTGNLRGYFHDVTITELNEFRAVDSQYKNIDKDTLDFRENQVYTSKTRTFDLRYANPGYKIDIECTAPHFTVTPTFIGDIGGENHGTRTINVSYTSTVPDTISGNEMIIIKDELGHTDTVRLYASSYKVEQRINWRADFEAIEEPSIRIKNGDITNAATATSQLPVTYTSSNPEVIEVINNGTALRPVAEGEAKITASQAGNETWQPAKPSTKTFIVTDKLLQYIVWDDNLTNIIKDDTNPQTLTLTARVYLQLEGGAIEFSQEKTNQLIYQSGNDNVVSVNGNTLTINNVGRTTLTATIEGDDNYATATLSKTVIVRSATLGCEDNLLYEHTGDPIQFFQMNLNEIIKDPIALNLKQGIPGYVTLAHYGESWNLGVQYYAAEIRVEQSLDNGNNWQTIQTISPIKDQENVDTIPLSRQATHIRFVRNSGGQGYQFLYNIDVHPAQYIEAQDIVDFGQIHVGSQETRTFTLYYSNIKHALSPVPSTTEITATPKTIGECSGFDTVDVSVTWLPTQVNENATATITFTDPNSGMEKVVTLKAKVVMGTQNIVWDNIPTVIEDCGDINFPEKTTASLPITWTVIEGNQFADFNEDGMLEIYRNGTITVQATQEGTGNYKPLDPVTYTFAIQLNIAFVGTEDSEWSNPNNWAMCRLPYADEVAIIEVPAILSMHATIAGIIFATSGDAQKGSIHITSTGGLTVGEQGITNAANDGSSILIDNKPNGAGFLLISPNANEENKYPQFTMNYTTRAFNEGVPRDETWQYMGAPGNNAKFKYIDDQTLIYHWDETKGWIQKSNSELNPIPTWQGYALTQSVKTNHNYQITAQAIQGSQTINLTKTDAGMKGDNLFVNSFTAPIDITKIDPETDITGTWDYQTFYLFNTGSWNEWQGVNTDHKHDASSPGHYYTIPIRSAKYLDDAQTIVPPMQGIYVHTEAEASITLDYTKHVWNGTPGNTPMRAPQKQDPDFRRIRIQASSQNSGADRMYIIQEASTTRGYDNGYDGKNINANGQVNIYTNEPFGKMEVSCANNIDSMYIGFRAGSDSEYQLIFSSLIGDSLYLKDLDNNTIIHMEEGDKYHFFATPNSINNSRFQILLHPSEVSDDDTTTDDNQLCQTNIWIENYHLHITNAPINSRAIIYAVSGQQVASYSVNNAYYTIPLSSLNNGIYILQLNNQRYKFVCK